MLSVLELARCGTGEKAETLILRCSAGRKKKDYFRARARKNEGNRRKPFQAISRKGPAEAEREGQDVERGRVRAEIRNLKSKTLVPPAWKGEKRRGEKRRKGEKPKVGIVSAMPPIWTIKKKRKGYSIGVARKV